MNNETKSEFDCSKVNTIINVISHICKIPGGVLWKATTSAGNGTPIPFITVEIHNLLKFAHAKNGFQNHC